jgi:enoyl-[acyl-carrier protein] reductase II
VKSAIDRSDGAFGVNCPVANEFVDAAGILVRGTIELREHDPELRERLRVVITSAGDPLPWADAIRATDLVWIHVVPSIYHLRRAEKAGVDAVIASGHEGGAHISWQPVHSMVLIPGVVEATPLPVIAAGGICDGRTLAAALALGAVGAQMGTRFIATRECDFWDVWKQAILDSSERETLVGRGMFGPMRFIANPASKALVEATLRHVPDFFKGLPVELRESMIEMERKGFEALAAGRGDESLILAGEVSGRIEDLPPVAELIDRIVADACEIARTLPGLVEER